MPSISLGLFFGGLISSDGIVAVLRAYLDDSGTDKQSPIVLMAGYVAPLHCWRRFESRARKLMRDEGIDVFHAKEFQNNNGVFKGWGPIKQLTFVTQLYDIAKTAGILKGVSHATQKDVYRRRGVQTGLNQNRSAYGWCFQMLTDKLFQDEEIMPIIQRHGISFFIEDGNPNNPDVEAIYERYRTHKGFGLADVLKGISFVPKTDSVAIQFADFLAYFTRRHGEACVKAGGPLQAIPPYLEIAKSRLPHYGFVANEFFGEGPSGAHLPPS